MSRRMVAWMARCPFGVVMPWVLEGEGSRQFCMVRWCQQRYLRRSDGLVHLVLLCNYTIVARQAWSGSGLHFHRSCLYYLAFLATGWNLIGFFLE